MRYPRYTTYSGDEELTAAIDKLDPLRLTGTTAFALRQSGSTGFGGEGTRAILLKEHTCAVLFPDGVTGECRYVRGGPAWHIFGFKHPGRGEGSVRPMHRRDLPTQHLNVAMANTPTAIVLKAQELADTAYDAAIRREAREYFRRVTQPAGYDDREWCAPSIITCKRAKEIAGKFAVCLRLGDKLIPAGDALFDTIEEANAAWKESADKQERFVACACRWSRRWEMPRFNALYRELDHRGKEGTTDVKNDTAE